MTSLRSQIHPILEEFKKANGKGSVTAANLSLIKIIETLVSHIEQPNYSLIPGTINAGVTYAANVVPWGNFTAAVVPNTNYTYTIPPDLYAGTLPPGWVNPTVAPTVTPPAFTTANYVIEKGASDALKENSIDVEKEVIEAVVAEAEKEVLLQAVQTLNEANYVIGEDYTAIVDHIENPPDPTADASPADAKADPETTDKRSKGRPKKGGA